LRPPTAGDGEEFARLNRASRRLNRGLGAPPVTRGQFAAYRARCRRANFVGFLICRVADGVIVGGVNLSEIVRGRFDSAYLGYQIGAPFARQGYMSEALVLALRIAFGRLRTSARRGEHPTSKCRADRPRPAGRPPPGGILTSLSQDRRPLA
jgi:ribosomal-protein-alanine N-acetyltransferase